MFCQAPFALDYQKISLYTPIVNKQNQMIVGIAAAVIIVLGLGGYFLYGRNAATTPTRMMNTSASNTNGNNMMQSSIKDLFASGETKQCTFSVKASSGGSTEGLIYVSGTNAAGKFTMMDTKGKATTTNLVRNADSFYIWGGGLPTGIKMSMNVDEMAQKMQSSPQTSSSFDPNAKVDFKCNPWTQDLSMFSPPTNIRFTDVSAMMPHATEAVTPGSQGRPNAGYSCAGITDPATKTACENAMHQAGY